MADHMLLAAIKTKPKKLSLANKNLYSVPSIIGLLDTLTSITLKSNNIESLPNEFAALYSVSLGKTRVG